MGVKYFEFSVFNVTPIAPDVSSVQIRVHLLGQASVNDVNFISLRCSVALFRACVFSQSNKACACPKHYPHVRRKLKKHAF